MFMDFLHDDNQYLFPAHGCHPFCFSLGIRRRQPLGQEEKLPGLMLGIEAEIRFKYNSNVASLVLPHAISQVALCTAAAEKSITKIQLSGRRVLLLCHHHSHQTSGRAIPEGNQSRSVRCFSAMAGKMLRKKMNCSPSLNH